MLPDIITKERTELVTRVPIYLKKIPDYTGKFFGFFDEWKMGDLGDHANLSFWQQSGIFLACLHWHHVLFPMEDKNRHRDFFELVPQVIFHPE